MVRLVRHLLAVLILPCTVVIIVPRWLLGAWHASDTRWIDGAPLWAGRAVGGVVLGIGLTLLVACIALFARVGRGTLAPWDPTQRLVAVGPYRYVRNPMISGVLAILVGESLGTGSRVLACWAATFFAFNHVYFLLAEEPGLERRFGESYRRYKSLVPRWIPRVRPIE
jgi:protein-S-isoprenylcysteine O-methyltransferase Ste14